MIKGTSALAACCQAYPSLIRTQLPWPLQHLLQSSATAESEGDAGTSGSAAPVPEVLDANDSSSADVAGSNQSSPTAVANQTDTQPAVESSRGNKSDSAGADKVTQLGQVQGCAGVGKPDADENVSDDVTPERGPSDSGQDPATVPRTWYCILHGRQHCTDLVHLQSKKKLVFSSSWRAERGSSRSM